jgi:dTDP-4-dehydrorhamnose reductase
MPSLKRVAVVGSTGQLGSDVVQVLSNAGRYEVTALPRGRMDVTDRESVTRALAGSHFDVVVNCAAFTRVDECEDRPDEALLVNARGAYEVVRACGQARALCVFFSTDYVFSGEKGSSYTEEDCPAPVNVYGISKLAGELLVQEAASRWLILRIASVFGKSGNPGKGGNFVETILSKARSGGPVQVVNDMWMSPAYTMDVARALDGLIQADVAGLYHGANAGRCTWFEFACEAVRMVGLDAKVEPISSDHYLSRARRPRDSSMQSSRIEQTLGRSMPFWQDALEAYLVETGHIRV